MFSIDITYNTLFLFSPKSKALNLPLIESNGEGERNLKYGTDDNIFHRSVKKINELSEKRVNVNLFKREIIGKSGKEVSD